MSPELDKKLCKDFPLLYRNRSADKGSSNMRFGFPGDGWEPLIRKLSKKLEAAIKKFAKDFPGEDPPCAAQVKEKFGTLRFYLTHSNDALEEWIDEAEIESAVTCEVCGAPGRLRTKGWAQTLCDEHARAK